MSDMDTTADRPWTLEAVQQLTELAREGVPVPVISLKLKRSIASIYTKLTELRRGLTCGREWTREQCSGRSKVGTSREGAGAGVRRRACTLMRQAAARSSRRASW